jgi:hypothetical protein
MFIAAFHESCVPILGLALLKKPHMTQAHSMRVTENSVIHIDPVA